MIIRGGNNIYPTDVENAITLHPAVREVAVVAFRPGHRASADELREHTLEHLAKYKVPRQWEFVDALPRNATGKVVKERLRQQFDGTAAEAGAPGGSPR